MRLLIIDNYDSFTHNLIQLVEQSGVDGFLLLKNDALDQLSGDEFDKVLISPGPGIAQEAGQLMAFIKRFYKEKDMLGICLGFEAIGECFGARLVPLPKPLHGIRNIGHQLFDDEIFENIPEKFNIGHYHSWNFQDEAFPNDLQISLRDENGLIMAFKHAEYKLRGLQFHPESVMTEHGLQIINNWLSL